MGDVHLINIREVYELVSSCVCVFVKWRVCKLINLSDHEFANNQTPSCTPTTNHPAATKEKRCKEHSLHLFNIVAETRLEHVTSRL